MAKSDMLLKVDTGGTGEFETVAGLRVRRFHLNACMVDLDNPHRLDWWKDRLAEGEVRRVSLTGSGVFKDSASDELIRRLFFAGTTRDWHLILPDFGTVQCPIQIVALEFHADHAGEVTFDLALQSAGPVSLKTEIAPPHGGRNG